MCACTDKPTLLLHVYVCLHLVCKRQKWAKHLHQLPCMHTLCRQTQSSAFGQNLLLWQGVPAAALQPLLAMDTPSSERVKYSRSRRNLPPPKQRTHLHVYTHGTLRHKHLGPSSRRIRVRHRPAPPPTPQRSFGPRPSAAAARAALALLRAVCEGRGGGLGKGVRGGTGCTITRLRDHPTFQPGVPATQGARLTCQNGLRERNSLQVGCRRHRSSRRASGHPGAEGFEVLRYADW